MEIKLQNYREKQKADDNELWQDTIKQAERVGDDGKAFTLSRYIFNHFFL